MPRYTSRYEALQWAKSLLNNGITKYYYPDLPENMQNLSLHLKSSKEGFVTKTGLCRKYSTGQVIKDSERLHKSSAATQYCVNSKILNLTRSNQKV